MAVQSQEDTEGDECDALIAIDECMILCQPETNGVKCLFGRDGDFDAVELVRAGDLTREARVGLDGERHVEHVDLGIGWRRQLLVPAFIYIDMAGGTGTGTAAFCRHRQAGIAQNFHHAPAVAAFDRVFCAFAVGGDDLHQCTPNFFCRLDDDVVYWKRSFSLGLQIWNAACAISAASWKPERINLSLPG